MSTNSKTFSTAKLHCTNTALELQFLGDPTSGQPRDPTPRLLGALVMQCSEPRCLSGTDPVVVGGVFALDMSIQLTQGSATQPSLLAIAAGMATWVPVPVLDISFEALCQELQKHRVAAQLDAKTLFYVYKVTDTPAELASLRSKLIAVPVLPGLPGNLA